MLVAILILLALVLITVIYIASTVRDNSNSHTTIAVKQLSMITTMLSHQQYLRDTNKRLREVRKSLDMIRGNAADSLKDKRDNSASGDYEGEF